MNQGNSETVGQYEAQYKVYLTPWAFYLCWWFVFATHVVVGGFAGSVVKLATYLRTDIADNVVSLQLSNGFLDLTAWSFFMVMLGHGIAICGMLWHSFQARRLSLHTSLDATADDDPAIPQETSGVRSWLVSMRQQATQIYAQAASKWRSNFGTKGYFGFHGWCFKLASTTQEALASMRQQATQLYAQAASKWLVYFGTKGYFGFQGEYFEVAFTVQEAIQIVLQTYQAYKLSHSVPRVGINRLAVGAIFLNCISTPLVHVAFRNHVAARRLLNLVLDAVLDVTCTVVVSLAIVLPYATAFNTKTGYFDAKYIMDDVWFVNAISEARQMLVTSMADYISTIVPQLSVLSGLSMVKNVLRCQSPSRSVHPQPINHNHHKKNNLAAQPLSPVTSSLPCGPALKESEPRPPTRESKTWRATASWRARLVDMAFVLWGFATLGSHLQAHHMTSDGRQQGDSSCRLYMSAWYATGFACSVMNLNCHTHRIRGSPSEISAILDRLDRPTLRILVFLHCPALHVPPIVTEFPYVIGLELFNCSLVDWPIEAAVQETTQPDIGYLFLIRTNWTTFPAGLLHDKIPTQLTHLMIVESNVTHLPETLGDVWATHKWILVNLEGMPFLHEIPRSMCDLNILWLTFIGSAIETLPENCFPGTELLTLSGTKLQALPAQVAFDLDTFQSIAAEHVESLTELPTWYTDWVVTFAAAAKGNHYYLYGSPVCQSSTFLNSSAEYWQLACETDHETTASLYPWEYMLPQRKLDDMT